MSVAIIIMQRLYQISRDDDNQHIILHKGGNVKYMFQSSHFLNFHLYWPSIHEIDSTKKWPHQQVFIDDLSRFVSFLR